jgi:hypothetical protein
MHYVIVEIPTSIDPSISDPPDPYYSPLKFSTDQEIFSFCSIKKLEYQKSQYDYQEYSQIPLKLIVFQYRYQAIIYDLPVNVRDQERDPNEYDIPEFQDVKVVDHGNGDR